MPSAINPDIPVNGTDADADPIRANFAAARAEIDALQAAVASLQAAQASTQDIVVNVTTSRAVLANETGTTFVNDGATGAVEMTLPEAVIGRRYAMYVAADYGFSFKAIGTNTIANGGDVGGPAGSIYTETIGNEIVLHCRVAGQWSVGLIKGEWDLT